MTVDEQLSYLRKGTVEIIREEELRAKLEKSARTGKPLRVKLGADPTAPDIHLGHTVVIRKLLDPEKTVIDFNSRWMDQLGSVGFLRLASHVTVRQILERDDFKKRLDENRPLALHEVMYPLVMAYDSVALEADVE